MARREVTAGVRRFSKLPRPSRSGILWRSKSIAVLAPSSYEPLMDREQRLGEPCLSGNPVRPEMLCLFPTRQADRLGANEVGSLISAKP